MAGSGWSWWQRRRNAAPASRMDVRPPSTWGQAAPVWRKLWQRLRGTGEVPDEAAQLSAARGDFLTALGSLQSPAAVDLALRANHARSLRELWHLRADLYNLIACAHSQGEAERRLAGVNRHFQAQVVGGRQSGAGAAGGASLHTQPPRQGGARPAAPKGMHRRRHNDPL